MTYIPSNTKVALGSLMKQIEGVVPTSEVLTDTITASAQTFTALDTVPWTAGTAKFNLQGQNWIEATTGNWAGGAKNDTSARNQGGVPWSMVTEFEFMYSGDKLDIMVNAAGAFDCQVYVEHQGEMMKLRDKPLAGSAAGYMFRNIKFAATQDGAGGAVTRGGYKQRRIRVLLGGNATFVQLNIEAAAIVHRAPLRHMFVIGPSDSYCDPFHSQNPGSDETYFCYGVAQAMFEATQFQVWNGAEGGTAFFQNGDGVARTTDTASAIGASRFGSAARRNKIAAGFIAGAADPYKGISNVLFYMGHGTINDGALSGGSVAMKARAKTVFQEALAQDPSGQMVMIHVGPEPYTLSNPPAGVPGYQAGGVHDINRLAQIAAVAEVPNAYFIDASDPNAPWWTGNGYNNNGENQQAIITGADGIHGNYRGYYNHGRRIANAIRHIRVSARRVNGEA